MRRGVVIALFVIGEALIVWSHPEQSKAVLRYVYDTLWAIAPKPEGFEPPQRFR
jgi:hypothetical protein